MNAVDGNCRAFWDSEYVTNRRAEVRLANMEVLPRAHFLPVCYATSGPRIGIAAPCGCRSRRTLDRYLSSHPNRLKCCHYKGR